MSNARENILQQVRQTLGRQTTNVESEFKRLALAARGAQDSLEPISNPVKLFALQCQKAASHVIELAAIQQLPGWLRDNEIQPDTLALAPQQDITHLEWSAHELIENYQQEICTAVVKAPLAAAETGTVLLHSTIVPTGLLFLAETLVIALDKKDIKPRYEDLWAGEQSTPHNSPPASRAVHLITGPSRTADVEQQIQIGAHGPREVYIILLGESEYSD